MLEKIKEYFESEYEGVKGVIEGNVSWITPREVVGNAIQRMLGVVMFAQKFDVSYEEIDFLYTKYCEELKSFLT